MNRIPNGFDDTLVYTDHLGAVLLSMIELVALGFVALIGARLLGDTLPPINGWVMLALWIGNAVRIFYKVKRQD